MDDGAGGDQEETGMARLLFHCTHGRDDPERAIVPFIAANVAAASGQEAAVVLTVEGAWLCRRGYAETVERDGFPKLAELLSSFVEAGGEIWGCSACTTPRGITEDDLVPGARIVGAAAIVAAVADGATPVALG
jgi:predicted peroxiredoxin